MTCDLTNPIFTDEEAARKHFEALRWPDGPVCPFCGVVDDARELQGKSTRPGLFKCHGCQKPFTATIGTVYERSHIPLTKWLLATHVICASKKGISALQLHRMLGFGSYRTAWFMAHRIRHAFPIAGILSGDVEADETYVGGKPRKVPGKQGKNKKGRGTRKVPVVVLVERNGRSRAVPTTDAKAKTLAPLLRENIDQSARLITDEWRPYIKIGREFKGGHDRVEHGKGEYARGDVHVNTAESWNALLKRGIIGSFHHVSPWHLHLYCDEFSFRWNHRKVTDSERTTAAVQGVAGKRLMYRQRLN